MMPIDMTAQLAPIGEGMVLLLVVCAGALVLEINEFRAARFLRRMRRFLGLEGTIRPAVRA